ncbi:unnamed protein product [Rotaria socialis]
MTSILLYRHRQCSDQVTESRNFEMTDLNKIESFCYKCIEENQICNFQRTTLLIYGLLCVKKWEKQERGLLSSTKIAAREEIMYGQ